MKTTVHMLRVLVLLALLLSCGRAQAQVNTGGGSVSLPTTLSAQLSRNCGSFTSPQCIQINANGHYVIDATSNSTTTVTCPNSDCNFTSNDSYGRPRMVVGQKIWATTQGGAAGTTAHLNSTTFVCPTTTVASFTAQSVTLNLACTANGTANVVLIWGTDDGTTLASLDSTVGCAIVNAPDTGDGFIIDSQPFLVVAPSCATNSGLTASVGTPAPGIQGNGFGTSSSVFVITPDFNWAGCQTETGASQKVCIGGSARFVTNVQFWGTGLTSASNSNCASGANMTVVEATPVSSVMYGLDVDGVCPGQSGMRGIEVADADGTLDLGGAQDVGTVACAVHGNLGISLRGNLCADADVSGGLGLVIDANAQASDYSSFGYAGMVINGTLTTRGTWVLGGPSGLTNLVTINSGGFWYSYSDFVGTQSLTSNKVNVGVQVNSGGQLQTANTTYAHASSTVVLNSSISNAGVVISLGGNKLNLLNVTSSGGVWQGIGVIGGVCQGTPTASSTLGFFQAGQFSTPNCTSTTTSAGATITALPLSGSVFNLAVTAVTSGSATFNVIKCHQGTCAATGITCSMSTSSFCQDSTHFDTSAIGDVYAIEEVTGASGNPVNVTATLLDW